MAGGAVEIAEAVSTGGCLASMCPAIGSHR